MTSNKLRVGIIGIGFYSAAAHVPQLRATGRAEVVAIARRTPERLNLIQKELGIAEAYTDWREMLDKCELDAVVVSTPHNQHVAPTVAALERGLHVLLEKPAADTIDGALQIAEAAEKSGKIVTVGVNSRGTPVWRGVHNAVRSGAIGSLRQINFVCGLDARLFRQRVREAEWIQKMRESSDMMRVLVNDFVAPTHWRRDVTQMGGDIMMDVGAHAVDVMLWLAGSRPMDVVAFKPHKGPDSTTILNVQVRLANDVLLAITFNDCVNEGDAEFGVYGVARTTALGDCGWLTVDSSTWGVQSAKEAWLERDGGREALQLEGEEISPAAAFVATVLDGAPNLCTAQEGAQTVALIQSAYRSAAEGKIVTLR